eukprot:gene1479-2843_t
MSQKENKKKHDPKEDNTFDESFRDTQSNIKNLLDTLATSSSRDELYTHLQEMEENTTNILSNFQSNLNDMQHEFSGVLESFNSGSMTSGHLESFLQSEHKKGVFSLQLAEDLSIFIDKIFYRLNDVVSIKGNDESAGGLSIEDFKQITRMLDSSLLNLESMSRVSTSCPSDVARAIHTSDMKRLQLLQDTDGGHYTHKFDQKVGTNIPPSIQEDEEYEETSKDLTKRAAAIQKKEQSLRLREAIIARREQDFEKEIEERIEEALEDERRRMTAMSTSTDEQSNKSMVVDIEVQTDMSYDDLMKRELMDALEKNRNKKSLQSKQHAVGLDFLSLQKITATIASYLPMTTSPSPASSTSNTRPSASSSATNTQTKRGSNVSRRTSHDSNDGGSSVGSTSSSPHKRGMSTKLTLAQLHTHNESNGHHYGGDAASVGTGVTVLASARSVRTEIPEDTKNRRAKYGTKPSSDMIMISAINTMTRSTSTSDLAQHSEAPVVPTAVITDDNHGLDPTFKQSLSSAENPLLFLYESYKEDMCECSRSHLLQAATKDICQNSSSLLSKLFQPVSNELQTLKGSVAEAEMLLKSCSDQLGSDVLMSATLDDETKQVAQNMRIKTYKDIGALTTCSAKLHLELSVYRSMFETVNASDLARQPKLLKSSVEYQKSYKTFLDCQGKLHTLQSMVTELRAKSKPMTMADGKHTESRQSDTRHSGVDMHGHSHSGNTSGSSSYMQQGSMMEIEINENLNRNGSASGKYNSNNIAVMSSPEERKANYRNKTASSSHSRSNDTSNLPPTGDNSVVSHTEYMVLYEKVNSTQKTYEDMREQLIKAIEENTLLKQRLFESEKKTDHTPSALLFFATLQDDGTIPNMQQLVLQLTNIKTFVEGDEHMDFPTLRKRLQVCVDCMPTVHNLLTRFMTLHSKWSQDRAKMFTERNYLGGDADQAMICPLCNTDSRIAPGGSFNASDNFSVAGEAPKPRSMVMESPSAVREKSVKMARAAQREGSVRGAVLAPINRNQSFHATGHLLHGSVATSHILHPISHSPTQSVSSSMQSIHSSASNLQISHVEHESPLPKLKGVRENR